MRSRGESRLGRTILGILGVFAVVIIIAVAVMLFFLALDRAWSRDLGQWEHSDPAVKEWFSKLVQPDTVGMGGGGTSCCGEGDAYWADESHIRDGKVFAVITDDRPDGDCGGVEGGPAVPCRIHEKIGTEYEVPPRKIVGMEQRLGNPTGHTVIFLGVKEWVTPTKSRRFVLCYVMNGGV
jgi:hypothetical protein